MFKKKVKIISNNLAKVDHLKRFSSFIGKKVYSKRGDYLGKVDDLLFKKDCFLGVLIGKLFIGKEFFYRESEESITLKINPVTGLIGKQVFDAVGKKVGTVRDIKRRSNSNNYTDLVVKKAFYSRSVFIPKKDIDVAKKNIILKKAYEK